VGIWVVGRTQFVTWSSPFWCLLLHRRLSLKSVLDWCCAWVDLWTLLDFWWSLLADTSLGSLHLWISEEFAFACFLPCFDSYFHLHCPFFDSLWLLTCFVFHLAFHLFGLPLVYSCFLWHSALPVNSLSNLIIFRMLGVYVDSSLGTLIPTLWVHISLLDFSVVECNLVLLSRMPSRVSSLFKRCCSADNFHHLNGIAPRFCTCRLLWFRWSDMHSWGPVEHLWDQWDKISVLDCGFYWQLGIPQRAAVSHLSQIWLVLPLAVFIVPCTWSPQLYLRFHRFTQFVWFLTAGLPCHFLSLSSYASQARTPLPHEFPLHAMIGAMQVFPYLLLHTST